MLDIYRVEKWRDKYLSLLSTLRNIDNKPMNGQIIYSEVNTGHINQVTIRRGSTVMTFFNF